MSPEREAWHTARQRYRGFCLLAIVVSLAGAWTIRELSPADSWLVVVWLASVVGFFVVADQLDPGERPD